MANVYWVGGTATWNTTNGTKWSATSGGAGGAGRPTATDTAVFDANSGNGTVTIGAGVAMGALDTNGFTGTIAGSTNFSVSAGGLRIGAGTTWTNTAIITFTDTSGTVYDITSNGKSFLGNININGPGGSFRLGDAFDSQTITVTVTAGSFSSNAKNFYLKNLSSSNSNVRSITLDNSNVKLAGTGSVLGLTTITNLTWSAVSSSIHVTDASGTAKTLTFNGSVTLGDLYLEGNGAGTYSLNTISGGMRDLYVANTNAACMLDINTAMNFRNIDFTGFVGTYLGGGLMKPTGSLTCGAGMTWSGGDVSFRATSGVQTITLNGVAINASFEFDGVGGEWRQVGDLNLTSSAVPSIQFINGTYRSQGYAISAYEYDGSTDAFGPRTVDFTNSTLTCLAGVDPWYFPDLSNSGVLIMTGSTIIMAPVSGASTPNFHGGGATYNILRLTGTGNGGIHISQSNTFDTIETQKATAHTIQFDDGSTQTIRSLIATGTAGNVISLRSAQAGVQALLSCPANDITCDYLDIKDISAGGGARWFAGRHSTNTGNNYGWRFTDRYRSPVAVSA